MKIKFITLGCKVNQFESSAMADILRGYGHTVAAEGEAADAYFINTCAVTAESGRKSRQAVRHAMKENPGAFISVFGCWSQLEPEEAAALGADLVCGTGDHRALLDRFEALSSTDGAAPSVVVDDVMARRVFEELPPASEQERTRAMLKIEDGCDNYCAYCIIPYTRGHVRSLPPEKVLEEAARLADCCYRELVVTGIEISAYGRDLAGAPDLAHLVGGIAGAVPGVRIRLGSLHPTVITEDFCRTLSRHGNVCPHFHLSMQSGCDRTLKRMGRRYGTAEIEQALVLLRTYFPNCGTAADIIVGFPGETEADFEETLAFLERCSLSFLHVFPFSARPGTRAASMDGQCTRAEKRERVRRLSELAAEMQERYLQKCVGSVLEVLIETPGRVRSLGHAGNYALVSAEGFIPRNSVANVHIERLEGDILVGKRS